MEYSNLQYHISSALTRQQWRNVLLMNESRFCLQDAYDRLWVWHRNGEQFAQHCVQGRGILGGGRSIMVWEGISLQRKYCSSDLF